MTCDHCETTTEWVKKENWSTGEVEGRWEQISVCLQDDIDLHRFKCSRCGEIGYYSGAARRIYEGDATADDYARCGMGDKS